MNNGNLKPFKRGNNARENGAKGGKKSGEAKREKKRIKDFITDFLDMEAPATDTMLEEYNLDYYTNAAVIALRLTNKAKRGDIRAVKLLLEITGELEQGKLKSNDEENELYQKGYRKGQIDVFEYLNVKELESYMNRVMNKEKVYDNKPVFLPDGRMIYGEDELK